MTKIQVSVVCGQGSGLAIEHCLSLDQGATVADAVDCWSGAAVVPPNLSSEVGIWGRRVALDTALSEGDRIEIYQVLSVDPKLARRERFRRQGARATGLFAHQRTGGKAGY